jgi:serine/threonine-protein kinase RsbW
MKIKTFLATLEQLYPMLDFVHDFSGDLQIRLAVEEALVNIIRYGYPENQGSIQICCEHVGNALKICIEDQGIPFDPVSYKVMQSTSRNGGAGIPLMKKIMDQIEYKRVEGKNILTLVKGRGINLTR